MKQNTLLALLALSFLSALWLSVVSPLQHGGACSCPPNGYRIGFAVKTALENYTSRNQPLECALFGCSASYFVIPLDLILLTAGLFITYRATRNAR